MIIKNGTIFDETGHFSKKDLIIDDAHKISHIFETGAIPAELMEESILGAEGCYVLPGLVDVHIHGAVGHDFCDGSLEGLKEIAAYLKKQGITSFCPTSMTLPLEELKRIFATITQVEADETRARIAGIHMEGPFISPEKKGAQKASYISAPNVEFFRELNDSCGKGIRLITIAPEMEGSMDFIRELHDEVNISLGHSSADYDIATEAFAAGANHGTHLFNAMPPFHHRDPGIIGAAADCKHAMVEMICDGIHLHPAVIRSVFSLFGKERVILISDAMRATGMEDGIYELGGQDVYKKGNRATLADGTLAGSATCLYDCLKNVISFGIAPEDAILAATANPAKSIGNDHIGIIAVGKEADLLITDKDFNLKQVL